MNFAIVPFSLNSSPYEGEERRVDDTNFQSKNKTALRKKLRNELSKCELKVWYYLRKRQIHGVKFRRQVSIGNIVVDFYSPEIKLVLEIDGDSHYKDEQTRIKDRKRDEWLKNLGLTVIRFTNLDVMHNIEYSMNRIIELVESLKPPLAPLRKGRIITPL